MNNSKIKSNKVYTKKSKINGTGIYAINNIKKGETLYAIKGKVYWFAPDDDTWSMPHSVSYAQNKWMDPKPGNPLRYTNHSCKPNSIITKGLKLIAIKNIKKDEEVTMDYSFTENDFLRLEMCKCSCGNTNCRKKIEPIHYLPEKMIKENKKYLRKWLLNSYYKNKNNSLILKAKRK